MPIFSLNLSLLVFLAFAGEPGDRAQAAVGKANTTNISAEATTTQATATHANKTALQTFCEKELLSFPGAPIPTARVSEICSETKQLEGCQSVKGAPIFSFEKVGTDQIKGKRILSISLIHGDEFPSGSVNRAWMDRLRNIEARNTWRVIPLANPDGYKNKTRYNSNEVDINRNFPSKDWQDKAIAYWEKDTKKDKRRYPGAAANSEPETLCLVKQIEEFKPDFIISIHTPLGVLDFDGPPVANPGFKPLPWVGLGNFPGSLGRFMWVDKSIPVLTIELRGNSAFKKLEEFDRLQDVTGTVAIQAAGQLKKRNGIPQ